MANFTWNGAAGDGVWDTNGNWAGGAAPTSGSHNIYINAGANNGVGQNGTIVVGPTGTPSFDLVEIGEGYGGTAAGATLGTDSVSLTFGTVTVLRVNNTRMNFAKLAGTFTTANIQRLGACTLYFSSGAATTVYAGGDGMIIFEDNVGVTTFHRAGGGFRIKGDTSSPADLVMDIGAGASGEVWRRVAGAYISGTLAMLQAAEGDISSGTSVIRVGSGGTLDLRMTGNIDRIIAHNRSNVLGLNGVVQATKPTITDLIAHERANVQIPDALFTVTNKVPVGATLGNSA